MSPFLISETPSAEYTCVPVLVHRDTHNVAAHDPDGSTAHPRSMDALEGCSRISDESYTRALSSWRRACPPVAHDSAPVDAVTVP